VHIEEVLKMECILCKNTTVAKLSDIKVKDLCKVYSAWLSYDMSEEFKDIQAISYVECCDCGLRFFFPVIAGSDRFYDSLSKKMGVNYYQHEKKEYEFAAGFIKEDDTVLDVGSGPGIFKKYVKGHYTGLDFNPLAIERATNESVRVLNESIEEHTEKNTSLYSVVTAFQLIEHVADPPKCLQACLEALRPGGLLIISVPSEESFVSLQENAVLNMPPHHVSRWSDRSLLSLEKLFNLTCVDLKHEKLERIHYESFIFLLSNITVRTLLGWDKGKMIDVSFRKKIVNVLSRFLKPLYRSVYRNNLLWPNGHSVTAVLRKR